MDTESADEWAVSIATAAAPEEAELAPIILRAYLMGGTQRQDLFRRPAGDVVGGFGAGEYQPTFLIILQAFSLAAPWLHTLVTSESTGKYLAVIKDLLSIRDGIKRKSQAAALADDPYAALKSVIGILSKDLEKVDMAPDQRDLITYHVLQELLKNPTSSKMISRIAAK
jgi:hypothetical protein